MDSARRETLRIVGKLQSVARLGGLLLSTSQCQILCRKRTGTREVGVLFASEEAERATRRAHNNDETAQVRLGDGLLNAKQYCREKPEFGRCMTSAPASWRL